MRKKRFVALAVLAAFLLSAFALTGTAAAQTPTPQGNWGTGYRGMGPGGGMMLGPVAALLEMTPQQLAAELAAGKSVFEVAAAKGVSEQAVLDAAIAPYADTLARRVKYGYLSQEQADQLVAQQRERLQAAFSTAGGAYGYGGYGGWGCGMMGGYYANPNNSGSSYQGTYGGWGMMGRSGGMMSGGWGMGAGRGWW
jgi:hypothetical protein